MTWQDATSVGPILWLTAGGLFVMLVDAFFRRERHGHLTAVAVIFLILGALSAWNRLSAPGQLVFAGTMSSDAFTSFFQLVFVVVALATLATGSVYFARDRVFIPEFYPLVLFATVGMMVMVAATDMVTIFLGLETMSVALYVLAALQRRSMASNEAGFKYLILGAFSSAFLLYGMALLYGTTGTTNLLLMTERIGEIDSLPNDAMFWAGWGLLLVGLGFKIAMVPFHMWTPDVYEGSPAPVAGFMAAGVKAASFAALIRVVWSGLPLLDSMWVGPLTVLAVATMVVGNVMALAQTSLKRMLGYSAIAHAGYLLVGVISSNPAAQDPAARGVLFYLLVYALMNLGAFGLVSLVSHRDGENVALNGFAGLARRRPVVSAAMTVFMLSLAGIPPTAGFWGKLYVFEAAVREGHVTLAVIAILNSAVALFYYLRVIVIMYMREDTYERYDGQDLQIGATMVALALAVLWVGFFPGPTADLAQRGVEALFTSFQMR